MEESAPRVLITGGAGFIGSHLATRLAESGAQVNIVDNLSSGSRENLADLLAAYPKIKFVEGDIRDLELLESLTNDVEEVYHLAASVGVAHVSKFPIETIEANVPPTHTLFESLSNRHRAGEPIRVFLASSSEVYGSNPVMPWSETDNLVLGGPHCPRWSYALSKAIDEHLVVASHQRCGLPCVAGRLFNVVGKRQSARYGMVMPKFVHAAQQGQPLRVHGDGLQTRCFSHVSDVTRCIVELTRNPQAHGLVVNIGTDQPISIIELARRVLDLLQAPSQIDMQPYEDEFGPDFEDVPHRRPDLSRLRQLISDWRWLSLDECILDAAARNE